MRYCYYFRLVFDQTLEQTSDHCVKNSVTAIQTTVNIHGQDEFTMSSISGMCVTKIMRKAFRSYKNSGYQRLETAEKKTALICLEWGFGLGAVIRRFSIAFKMFLQTVRRSADTLAVR